MEQLRGEHAAEGEAAGCLHGILDRGRGAAVPVLLDRWQLCECTTERGGGCCLYADPGQQPFNAFLSGFSATIGQFVLTASLRIQTNPENKAEFESISHERYMGRIRCSTGQATNGATGHLRTLSSAA